MNRRAIKEFTMRGWRRLGLGVAIAAAALGPPAGAQILGPGGGVTSGLPNVGELPNVGGLPNVGDTVGRAAGDVLGFPRGLVDQALDPQTLLQARAERL